MGEAKECTKCGATKPLEEFVLDRRRKNERQGRCKECAKQTSKEWRERNRERKFANDKRWQEENPERVAELRKHWRAKNPNRYQDQGARHRKKNPDKARARAIVLTAVHDGRLLKPDHCEDCGQAPRRQDLPGHHEDYSKPYDVEWLCRTCHRKRPEAAA